MLTKKISTHVQHFSALGSISSMPGRSVMTEPNMNKTEMEMSGKARSTENEIRQTLGVGGERSGSLKQKLFRPDVRPSSERPSRLVAG